MDDPENYTRALISVEAARLSKQVPHSVGLRVIEMLGGGGLLCATCFLVCLFFCFFLQFWVCDGI